MRKNQFYVKLLIFMTYFLISNFLGGLSGSDFCDSPSGGSIIVSGNVNDHSSILITE